MVKNPKHLMWECSTKAWKTSNASLAPHVHVCLHVHRFGCTRETGDVFQMLLQPRVGWFYACIRTCLRQCRCACISRQHVDACCILLIIVTSHFHMYFCMIWCFCEYFYQVFVCIVLQVCALMCVCLSVCSQQLLLTYFRVLHQKWEQLVGFIKVVVRIREGIHVSLQ